MEFQFERLIEIRKSLGINKAEAARKLNMSAMGYGRYEKGERAPSFQTVSFIAKEFGTTTDYLYGISNDSNARTITISLSEDPELFMLVEKYKTNRAFAQRMLSYYEEISKL